MSTDQIRKLIDEYLDLVLREKDSFEVTERSLVRLLDHLAFAYHAIPDDVADDKHYPAPKRPDQKATRETISKRFPEYGFYNQPDNMTEKISDTELLVGDAIDDLVDITQDLSEISWRFKNTSPEDALWHYRLLFDGHWGEHLRYLQLYILIRRSESSK